MSESFIQTNLPTESEVKAAPRGYKPYAGVPLSCPNCHELHQSWSIRKVGQKVVGYFCPLCGETCSDDVMNEQFIKDKAATGGRRKAKAEPEQAAEQAAPQESETTPRGEAEDAPAATESTLRELPKGFDAYTGSTALMCYQCGTRSTNWGIKHNKNGAAVTWFCQHCGEKTPDGKMGIDPNADIQPTPAQALTNPLETKPAAENVELYARALVIHNGMDFDSWRTEVNRLATVESASGWWIGDALNYGEADYGEKYSAAIDESQAKTWQNYASVCMRYPQETRVYELERTYYRDVAYEDEPRRSELLQAAVDFKLSTRDFNKLKRGELEIKDGKVVPVESDEATDGETPETEIVVLSIPVALTGVAKAGELATVSFRLALTDKPALSALLQEEDRDYILTLTRRQ